MYVFAPYQFRKLFPGFPKSVRIRSMEHTRTASEIQSVFFFVPIQLQGMT